MQSEQDVINRWSNSAQFWDKHQDTIRQMFAPISNALIEDARIEKKQTVLDVATGPGEPALTVAAAVGTEGKVFGVDPIPDMVAAARRAADRAGLKNVNFEVALADHLPFPDEMFDAAVSRFGVMFFPSPVDAIREMLRVLKPNGRLALAVWHFAARNPFHHALSQVIDRYVDPAPLAPDALDTFRFAAPGKLLAIFSHAGVTGPAERILKFNIQVPISPEGFWTLRCEMSEVLREKLAKLSTDQAAEVRQMALDAFRQYSGGDGLKFPAEVLILSGVKKPRA